MSQQKPAEHYQREDLITRGLDVHRIPGLVNCEMPNFQQEVEKLQTIVKPSYSHGEIFGQQCIVSEFIEAPIDLVYEYGANPYSLEEFTATLRKVEHLGDGLYRGLDVLAPDTYIYIKMATFAEPKVIDCLCAWDQPHELWMRYNWRLYDGMDVLGKPGTLLVWSNFRHRYYDRDSPAPAYVAEPRARTDRMWVGDFWNLFYAAHSMEARNIKLILEHRVNSK